MTEKSILRLISGGQNLTIEALDGERTIAEAKKVFKSDIDSDFTNLGLNKPGLATGEMLMDVREITKGATFEQMFFSLSTDLDKIVLTQDQIIEFCEKYPAWFHQDGYSALFLIKRDDGEYFVVDVGVNSDGLYVRVNHFEDDDVWLGGCRHCLVSPQLVTLSA